MRSNPARLDLIDYTSVTEAPGVKVTPEAAAMLRTRYSLAARFCKGKSVLEVCCGSGMGLGYLARHAQSVVGGDITEALLSQAHSRYEARVPLVRLNAQALPFDRESFDTVILFEAIYYLERPEVFLQECRRVLRPQGALLICLPNKEWEGFNPSPFGRSYFSAAELARLLAVCGFRAKLFGAFSTKPRTLRENLLAGIRRTAVGLHAIPGTMRGKEFLKRFFYGRLVELPYEIDDGLSKPEELVPLFPNGHRPHFKVLYALASPTS